MLPHARRDNLLVQQIGDELIVYDLERHRAHRLSQPAALIWQHCDGQKTVADLARILETELNIQADQEGVWLVLTDLERSYLLRELLLRPREIAPVSRRQAIAMGLASAASLALSGCGIESVTAPTPIPDAPTLSPQPSSPGLPAGQLTPQQAGTGTCGCAPKATGRRPDPRLCTEATKGQLFTLRKPVNSKCEGTDPRCPKVKCRNELFFKCVFPGRGAESWEPVPEKTMFDIDKVCVPTPPPPSPPPPSPPPPPPCVTQDVIEVAEGKGKTEAEALRDLRNNAIKICDKICKKLACFPPAVGGCFNLTTPIFLGAPACGPRAGGKKGGKKVECVQIIEKCPCRCL